MRSIYGEANVIVFNGEKSEAIAQIQSKNIHSKSFPDADMYVVYTQPGFVSVYFVDNGNYYGMDYFTEIAATGSTEVTTADPRTYNSAYQEANGAEWCKINSNAD